MKKRSLSFVAVILVCVIAFSAGFITDRVLLNNTSIFGGLNSEQISLLKDVSKLIEDQAIEEHDSDTVVDYALKGMAASLNDPYAYYFTKEEIEAYNNSSAGVVEGGIGASVYNDNGKITITEVYKGLSASSVGMKAGDIIIAVDGVSVEGLTLDDTIAMVKGEPGTSVKINVLRENKELSFNVTRSNGQREMTEYCMLEDTGILYVKIISFHGNAVEYFEKAIEYGTQNNYKGIIIDLRENPGGELSIFADIADIILPEGTLFYSMDRQGNKGNVLKSDEACLDKPVAVLINGSSASASEALAGALRDIGKAKIVGTTSYGKGIMQTSYTLSNGGVFKLTVAKYYLPNGDCIHEKGIEPEFKVELNEELTEKYWLRTYSNDAQLQKAIEVLT